VLAIILVGTVFYLKDQYPSVSSGDYTSTHRRVQYADPISKRRFQQESKDYTQAQVQKLVNSSKYKREINEIQALKDQSLG
jgi:NAD-specific glutamate dehydrogenase